MIQEHVLLAGEYLADDCCTDGTRRELHTGIRKEKIRKIGSKAKKKEIVLKASIATKLPESALLCVLVYDAINSQNIIPGNICTNYI